MACERDQHRFDMAPTEHRHSMVHAGYAIAEAEGSRIYRVKQSDSQTRVGGKQVRKLLRRRAFVTNELQGLQVDRREGGSS